VACGSAGENVGKHFRRFRALCPQSLTRGFGHWLNLAFGATAPSPAWKIVWASSGTAVGDTPCNRIARCYWTNLRESVSHPHIDDHGFVNLECPILQCNARTRIHGVVGAKNVSRIKSSKSARDDYVRLRFLFDQWSNRPDKQQNHQATNQQTAKSLHHRPAKPQTTNHKPQTTNKSATQRQSDGATKRTTRNGQSTTSPSEPHVIPARAYNHQTNEQPNDTTAPK